MGSSRCLQSPSNQPDCLRFKTLLTPRMAPAATEAKSSTIDPTILVLRKDLTSEHVPLARRFRALFSLKHLASQSPGLQSTAAIEAIAAAFASPSALLKRELAYCLGQTKSLVAVPFLRGVLENRSEDAMCRHEAAEALGALGDLSSLELMKQMKDDEKEPVVVRETCDIAVDRIQWAHSESRKAEALKSSDFASIDPAPPMPLETEPCLLSEIWLLHPIFQLLKPQFTPLRPDSST